jgi:Protein of unknown function (DUF3089)
MRNGFLSARAPALTRGLRLLAATAAAALMLCGLTAGSALAAKPKPVKTTWLCRPGKAPDPCTDPLTTTVINTGGEESLEKAKKAVGPPINCFYVYPTVSEQPTPNANLEIEPQEEQIAIDQASRFSQDCRVWAPVYNQVTLDEANGFLTELPPPVSPFPTVLAAFEEFINKYDHNKGFVLIGHSQGSGELEELIATAIEGHPSVESKMVSALIMGGGVTVPNGQDVGGTFKEIPTCQTAYETHCVIAWSTFYKEPPNEPGLGRTPIPGEHVVCVNPAQLVQDNETSALLQPYETTVRFPGQIGDFEGQIPTASTPWVSTPGEYSAQCMFHEGAGWLQVEGQGTPHDPDEFVPELLPPSFGLHLFDGDIALGNTVRMIALQAQAYLFENEA